MTHDRAPKYYGGSFFAVRGTKTGCILDNNTKIVNIMVFMLLTYDGNILGVMNAMKDKL
jgi:hypothetical protein